MSDREKLTYASALAADEAARYLEALANGLRQHVMIIESGDSSIGIDVAREVRLELEAGVSRKRTELELKLAWEVEEGTEITPPVLKILPRTEYPMREGRAPKNGNGRVRNAETPAHDEINSTHAVQTSPRADLARSAVSPRRAAGTGRPKAKSKAKQARKRT